MLPIFFILCAFMSNLAQGIAEKHVRLEDDGKYIVYLNQNKRRNFQNPEEKV